ncbi:MAG: hypothetical protein P857_776 [Candidatus Xenolissoclinum pacificiensis L6]|uniref:Uncharacterized protein n=1 Tax=Candidatus Xenolissoclinum pacificiensis L6 TaxID=1401685 RepID=W2V1S1_9RICK|nr:MAG: hypothetical protein P857_776 [Candidatus Xenolissoclinum pacificiensis L6]
MIPIVVLVGLFNKYIYRFLDNIVGKFLQRLQSKNPQEYENSLVISGFIRNNLHDYEKVYYYLNEDFDNRRPTILVIPGILLHFDSQLIVKQLQCFRSQGFNVCIVGSSETCTNYEHMQESAIYQNVLTALFNQKNISKNGLIIAGHCYGATIALNTAVHFLQESTFDGCLTVLALNATRTLPIGLAGFLTRDLPVIVKSIVFALVFIVFHFSTKYQSCDNYYNLHKIKNDIPSEILERIFLSCKNYLKDDTTGLPDANEQFMSIERNFLVDLVRPIKNIALYDPHAELDIGITNIPHCNFCLTELELENYKNSLKKNNIL